MKLWVAYFFYIFLVFPYIPTNAFWDTICPPLWTWTEYADIKQNDGWIFLFIAIFLFFSSHQSRHFDCIWSALIRSNNEQIRPVKSQGLKVTTAAAVPNISRKKVGTHKASMRVSVNVMRWFTTSGIWSDMVLDVLIQLCALLSHLHGHSRALPGHAADKISLWVTQCVCLRRLMTSTPLCLAEASSCKPCVWICINSNRITRYRPVHLVFVA